MREHDDKRHVQRLARLIALCPACHEVKHIGLAGVRGRKEEAAAHLKEVNAWSKREADAHIRSAFGLWRRRTAYKWVIEVDWDALAATYDVPLSRTGREDLDAETARHPSRST